MLRKRIGLSLAAMTLVASLGMAGTAYAEHIQRTPVRILSFAYQPNRVFANPGQEIDVVNIDGQRHGVPHSLTARDGSFDTGVFTTGTRTITAPGRVGKYRFFCVVHPFMKGVLRVTRSTA